MPPIGNFAFSTNAFTRFALEEAVDLIAGAGFKGVEILADKPHAWLERFGHRRIERLASRLRSRGMFVSNINANCVSGFWKDCPPEPVFEPSVISRRAEFRRWRIEYTKKAMRLAKELDARNVSLTSGKTLNGVPPVRARSFLVDAIRELLDGAHRIGCRISLEYEPGLYIESTDEMAGLVAEIGDERFGANLDLGHVAVAGEDPCRAVERLRGHIFNIHMEDIAGRKHYHMAPGEGDMDFERIFETLDRISYDGPVTWEIYTCDDDPVGAARKAFACSRRFATEPAGCRCRSSPGQRPARGASGDGRQR
ncbi:MAG: sugar phosphate isomerase/epimerase [Planctomycetota bacterium]|nr:sugar phosphate isomerase/epimerase [Planctomycetota bacterium]